MSLTHEQLLNAGVAQGLLDRNTLEQLRRCAGRHPDGLLSTVCQSCRLPCAAFYRAWAAQHELPFLEPLPDQLSADLARRVPRHLLRRLAVVPMQDRQDDGIWLLAPNPLQRQISDLNDRFFAGHARLAVADPEVVVLALRQLGLDDSPGGESAADIIGLLDRLLREAWLRRASDLHLDPTQNGLRVRFRIDGRLTEYGGRLQGETAQALCTRVKVLAGMDIAEQRSPQDGSFTWQHEELEGRELDIRVASIPTHFGERFALRLLGTESKELDLRSLGLSAFMQEALMAAIQRPYGILLVTGPTGSGKSTTLYAALREIAAPSLNVITVEDPIEVILPEISQVQVGGGSKVTFARALRSLLRHDPDVLMVGEIRDAETADIALKAALTGHLVLASLHTNNAVTAITRLLDIGCESFLVASTVAGIIAQRLARRLCDACKRPAAPPERLRDLLELPSEATLHEAVGCPRCLGTGYRGRIGVFETLWIDRGLAATIRPEASEQELREAAGEHLTTLRTDARSKLLQGLVGADDVLRLSLGGM